MFIIENLTDEERSLFQRLGRNNWRIEQERLGEEWVIKKIGQMLL